MTEFSEYVSKLLKKSRLNRSEKKDLENELVEHLNNMKDDYIKQGMSEEDSINMAIKNFKKSDFLNEINDFTTSRKLAGINISYLLKINMLLIFIYIILMIVNFALFVSDPGSNLVYFLIICLALFVNYNYASSRFESKRDILLNISITCFIFFFIEKIGILILSAIYSILAANLELNILNLYILNPTKIVIYLVISTAVILFAKYDTNNNPKRYYNLLTTDIFVLSSSFILMLLYFLYPNRLYLLNLSISKIFGIDVEFFRKNLLYMNINNKFTIINIGLLLILLYMLYKFISRCLKINLKQ
ncbi:hypothetical protein N3C_2820 [Clostridium sp. N3C]|uniref:permease prefix domain 1-containing protein n=1 Tax=Clostridium sp. N3C TaxID=1776758 RepID=UPI00092DF9E8|nr:permease prefix domain 1-containing protein [Clostridium sp. N3C]SCN26416.1 hypothetical protein N3C_2820 [Clostridium sp. N3C]